MQHVVLKINSLFSRLTNTHKLSLRFSAVLNLLIFTAVLSITAPAQTSDHINLGSTTRRSSPTAKMVNTLDSLADKDLEVNSVATAPTATIVVTRNNPQGFGPSDTRTGGAVNFVYDSAAPGGFGALQLTTNDTTAAKADFFHSTNTPLANVTDLSYYTKQVSGPPVADASYQLAVFLCGPGSGFTTFVYEPYQKNGIPNNPIAPGVFEFQDVDQGVFDSSRSVDCDLNDPNSPTVSNGFGGAPFYSLATLKTNFPNAVVFAYGVNVGSNNPSYNVEVDLFNFNGTVFDFEPAASTLVVDDDGQASAINCDATDTAPKTIQFAVNAANPGDTVKVCPGIYPETIVINKPLTVLGAQAGVLAKPRTNSLAESIIVVNNSQTIPVDIQADNVTFDGFAFDVNQTFPTTTTTDKPSHLILANSVSGTAADGYNNLRILNNRLAAIAGYETVDADRRAIGVATAIDTLIEGNYIANYPSQSVTISDGSTNLIYRNNDSFNAAGSSITLQSNFRREPPQRKHVNYLIENNRFDQDGILLFLSQGGSIRNNTFTQGLDEAGILMLGGNDSVNVTNNTFALSNRQAMLSSDGGFGFGQDSNINFTGNTVTRAAGATTTGSFAAIDYRGTGGTNTISNNTVRISGTLPAGNTTFGIRLRGSASGNFTITGNLLDGGGVTATGTTPLVTGLNIISNAAANGTPVGNTGVFSATSVVNVNCNTFTRFQDGIGVFDTVNNLPGGLQSGANVAINRNNIAGNSVFGINNGVTSATINAKSNYWGAADGPGPINTGSGDRVTLNVDFNPFLTAPSPCAPALGTTAATTTISGRVLSNNGLGLARVSVLLTDLSTGQTRTTRTNKKGSYNFGEVEVGENYIVSLSLEGYIFSPSSKQFSLFEELTDVDFTASREGVSNQ